MESTEKLLGYFRHPAYTLWQIYCGIAPHNNYNPVLLLDNMNFIDSHLHGDLPVTKSVTKCNKCTTRNGCTQKCNKVAHEIILNNSPIGGLLVLYNHRRHRQ